MNEPINSEFGSLVGDAINEFKKIDTDENPAIRAISKLTIAVLEELENCKNTDRDLRESRINFLRLEMAVTELENMPPDVWAHSTASLCQKDVMTSLRQYVEFIRNFDQGLNA